VKIKFSRKTTFSSLVCFLSSNKYTTNHSNQKRKRTKTPKRERERERKRAADAWKRRKSFAFGHK
jgi:hypothetical protein